MESRKIDGSFPSANTHIKQITKEKIRKHLLKLSGKQGKDVVDLSVEAKKISEYIQIIKKMPEVREDRIKEVERKLSAGEYDSKEVLEKALKKLMNEIL